MAALTMLSANPVKREYQLLETIAVTNAAATTTVTKGFYVPTRWARGATFVLDLTITGTTPLFDFNLKGVNVAHTQPPDSTDVFLLGGAAWVGITQLTTDGSSPIITIHAGPNITTDTTGSATVDCVYGINCYLPPVMAYTYTYDGTTADEDYNGTISVYWHR